MIDTQKMIRDAEYHIKRGDSMVMDPQAVKELAELCEHLTKVKAAAAELTHDLHDLIEESTGVAGLHKNGQIAEWGTLTKDGHFEEWLCSLDDMDSVLANCLEPKNTAASKESVSVAVNEKMLAALEMLLSVVRQCHCENSGEAQDAASEAIETAEATLAKHGVQS